MTTMARTPQTRLYDHNRAPEGVTRWYPLYQGLASTAILVSLLAGYLGASYMIVAASFYGFMSMVTGLITFILALAALTSQPKHELLGGRGLFAPKLSDYPLARWVAIDAEGTEIPGDKLYSVPREYSRITHWRCLRKMFVTFALIMAAISGLLLTGI